MNPFEDYCDIVKYGKFDYQGNPKHWQDSWQSPREGAYINNFDVGNGDGKYESFFRVNHGNPIVDSSEMYDYPKKLPKSNSIDNLISDFTNRAGLMHEFAFSKTPEGREENPLLQGSTKITGTGNAKEVINKAASSLLGGIDKYKFPAIMYNSAGDENSRKNLYSYLTPKIKEYNPDYEPYLFTKDDKDSNTYFLVHKKHNDLFNQLAKIHKLNMQHLSSRPEKIRKEQSNPFWNFITKMVK